MEAYKKTCLSGIVESLGHPMTFLTKDHFKVKAYIEGVEGGWTITDAVCGGLIMKIDCVIIDPECIPLDVISKAKSAIRKVKISSFERERQKAFEHPDYVSITTPPQRTP